MERIKAYYQNKAKKNATPQNREKTGQENLSCKTYFGYRKKVSGDVEGDIAEFEKK